MNLHKHARLTPRGRALLVQRMLNGLRVEEAAQAAGVSVRTAYKWLRRFREEGEAGLMGRSSRPYSCPHATAGAVIEQLIELRRSRKTYWQIAQMLGLAVSTVARHLKQAGFHRLAELEPAPAEVRYEYANPGDLLHLDIKKLGRFWTPGHRVTGSPATVSKIPSVRAGSLSTWTSTMHPGWPSPACTRTSAAAALVGPCFRPCATTVLWASASGVS